MRRVKGGESRPSRRDSGNVRGGWPKFVGLRGGHPKPRKMFLTESEISEIVDNSPNKSAASHPTSSSSSSDSSPTNSPPKKIVKGGGPKESSRGKLMATQGKKKADMEKKDKTEQINAEVMEDERLHHPLSDQINDWIE